MKNPNFPAAKFSAERIKDFVKANFEMRTMVGQTMNTKADRDWLERELDNRLESLIQSTITDMGNLISNQRYEDGKSI